MEHYAGVVDNFFETGTEGVMWVLLKDGFEGYNALVPVDPGDYLKVFAEDGSIAFEGKIIPDWDIGWAEYPNYPGHGQPCALGYWIHWTQKGWEPDKWALLFFNKDLADGEHQPLRAELTKKQPKTSKRKK